MVPACPGGVKTTKPPKYRKKVRYYNLFAILCPVVYATLGINFGIVEKLWAQGLISDYDGGGASDLIGKAHGTSHHLSYGAAGHPWRIKYEGALYHVFSLGNDQQDIFVTDDDG